MNIGLHGIGQGELFQYTCAPGVSGVPVQVRQNIFCGTLLEALDDQGRIGFTGGPEAQTCSGIRTHTSTVVFYNRESHTSQTP